MTRCLFLSQHVDFETKRSYTLKVEGSNPYIDPQYIAWGPYKDEATIKVHVCNKADRFHCVSVRVASSNCVCVFVCRYQWRMQMSLPCS